MPARAGKTWPLLALLMLAPLSAPLCAQSGATRLELGQHLRAFEKAWENQKDPDRRRLSVKPLTQATQAFFSFRMAEALRKLDEAHLLLAHGEIDLARLHALSLSVAPSTRFVDAKDAFSFTVTPQYQVKEGKRVAPEFHVALVAPDAEKRIEFAEGLAIDKSYRWSPLEGKWNEGDHALELRVGSREKPLTLWKHTLSVVADRDGRLARLKESSKDVDESNTDRATLHETIRLLDQLAAGKTLETHYPAARLLAEAEALLKSVQAGKRYHGADHPGQHWVKLVSGKTSVIARVQVPPLLKGKKLPLVIALHGAGGSENLFFDGYGDGLIAKLCAARGMFLVAPRCPLLPIGTSQVGPIIDEMSKLYPVDESKVYVIGHSMGAAQALNAATQVPKRITALAALGGGRPVKMNDDMKKIAFFVGVGKEDFARAGAVSLAQSLKKTGASIRFEEYPNIEHLVIVQHALPDVFTFLDELRQVEK